MININKVKCVVCGSCMSVTKIEVMDVGMAPKKYDILLKCMCGDYHARLLIRKFIGNI